MLTSKTDMPWSPGDVRPWMERPTSWICDHTSWFVTKPVWPPLEHSLPIGWAGADMADLPCEVTQEMPSFWLA